MEAFRTFSEAIELIDRQQYEYAVFLLTEVIDADYCSTDSLCRRALCYMKMCRYKEASQDLENALILDRTIINAYVNLAKCYLAIGDLDNCIVAYTSLIQINPEDNFTKIKIDEMQVLKQKDKRAKKLFAEEQYLEVVKIMDDCLKNAEICIRFKLIKAECLIYLGEYETAIDLANDVLFTHKDDVEAICIRAMSLLYQEKYSLGIIEIKEIAVATPRSTNIYRMYQQIIDKRKNADKALRNNKLDEAKELYRLTLEIDKKNLNLTKVMCTTIAEISFRQELYNDAVEQSSMALEICPTHLKALKVRAESNTKLEEYDLAIEDYNEIIKQENNDANKKKLSEVQRKNKMIDNYSILGISKDTPVTEIKKIYKNLAKIHHPDKNSDKSKYALHVCKVKFSRINKAYNEILRTNK